MSRSRRPGEVARRERRQDRRPSQRAGRLPASASSLYAKNLYAFLEILVDKTSKTLAVNWDDEIVKATALTRDGAVIHPNFQPKNAACSDPERHPHGHELRRKPSNAHRPPPNRAPGRRSGADLWRCGSRPMPRRRRACGDRRAVDPFVFRFSIFVLAIFVGYYVVWAVTPALHTPLMSVTNAISSVIVVGALLAVGVTLVGDDSGTWLGARLRLHRADLGLGEHLRRLPGHPAHARHVQEEETEGAPAMTANLAALLYLVAGVLFILALRGLSSPAAAAQGNMFGMAGMAIAIVTTLALRPPASFGAWLLVHRSASRIGGGIGAVIARRVPMTAMPQLVAAFHSLVGMAAVLVAAGALYAPAAFDIGDARPYSAARAWSRCRSASPSAPSPSPAR